MYPGMALFWFGMVFCSHSFFLGLIQLWSWVAGVSCAVVAAAGFSSVFFWYHSGFSEQVRNKINLERLPEEGFEPRNAYMDFSRPIEYLCLTFVLQVGLTTVYVLSVVNNSDYGMPCFNQTWAYNLMWFAIFLRSIYFSLDYCFRSQNYFRDWTFWQTIQKATEANRGSGNDNNNDNNKFMVTWSTEDAENDKHQYDPELKREVTKTEYNIRFVLHTFINGCVEICLSILMIIQSTNGNFTDFVLNFVAARFIIELDDYSTWNLDSKFWIVKKSILEQEEQQRNSSDNDEESNNPRSDSSAVEGGNNQSEEINNLSDSSALDGEESSNQTDTNTQQNLSQRNQSLANQDQEPASEVEPLENQVKGQALNNKIDRLKNEVRTLKHEVQSQVQSHENEVQTLKNEVRSHKNEVQTLKNNFQALLTSLEKNGIFHHETMQNKCDSIETPHLPREQDD